MAWEICTPEHWKVSKTLAKTKISFSDESFIYEHFAKRKHFQMASSQILPCEMVHTTLCGWMDESSLGGSWWLHFLLFKGVFQALHCIFCKIAKSKSEIEDKVKNFLNRLENELVRFFRILWIHNGLEFVNMDITLIFKERNMPSSSSLYTETKWKSWVGDNNISQNSTIFFDDQVV